MSTLDLIRERRSVRTFDGNAPSAEHAKLIMDFAKNVINPYGLAIDWKLLDVDEDGLSSPVIVGAKTYIAGKMKRTRYAEEAFGYAFEKVVLFVQSLGMGTTWIAGTMNRSAFEKAMGVSESEVMPCVSPLGYPAKKMSLRESLMRKGVRADSRLPFGELFFDGSFDKALTELSSGKLASVLEAVRLAPSAVNKQPWRIVICDGRAHFYEKQSHGYVSDSGWDIQKIDMGIALCHFELQAKECGLDVSFETADPGIRTPDDVYYIASYAIR